jgi:hypothetical protein
LCHAERKKIAAQDILPVQMSTRTTASTDHLVRLQVPLTAAWVTLGLRAHPLRNILRQNRTVANIHDSIRQRVSLPARLAKRVLVLAETRKTSASRVLVDLIETGLRAKEAQHQRFFEITDQLAETSDPAERKRLQEELARMTFAE